MATADVGQERLWTRGATTWLIGFGTSLLGDEIFYVAITWAALAITSPSGVGLVLIANAVPRALILLVGGVLVDRVGPRVLVIAADSARVLVMVVAGLALVLGSLDLTVLVVIAVLFGVADGFFLPAVGAMPAFVAPPSGQIRLQAVRTLIMRASTFLGAPLASWLIVVGTVRTAFWVNAMLFAVSVAALAATRVRGPDLDDLEVGTRGRQGEQDEVRGDRRISRWWAELTEGLRVIGRRRPLLTLIVLVVCLEIGFTGPFTAGIPLLSAEGGWGVQGVGWLLGAFGLGAAVTAGVLALGLTISRPGLVMGTALTLMGLAVGTIGLVSRAGISPQASLGLAAAAACVTGMGAGFFGTLVNTAVLTNSPESQVGRVMSVVSLASFTALPVSLAATVWLTDTAGAAVPFVFGGALVGLAGCAALALPQIRRLTI